MTNDRKQKERGEPSPARKPYVKPAFRHEQVFETMALACGKVNTGSSCKSNKKTS
jgi:hypothetical protein